MNRKDSQDVTTPHDITEGQGDSDPTDLFLPEDLTDLSSSESESDGDSEYEPVEGPSKHVANARKNAAKEDLACKPSKRSKPNTRQCLQACKPSKRTKPNSPKPKKAGQPTKIGTQAKATRRTAYVPHRLRPDVAAHQFRSSYRRRAQVAEFLHRVFKNNTPIRVDFDLAVAYFLQQTVHLKLGNIPKSVDKIMADFSILAPLTGRQDLLAYCAQYIKETLNTYSANPEGPRPFALRYPNLRALHQLAVERSKSPTIVGKDEAVILLDLADRPLAVSIPPRRSQSATTLSSEDRARLAFLGAAVVHDLKVFEGPMTFQMYQQTTNPITPDAKSPFDVAPTASTRLTQADSSFVEVPGCINGSLSSQGIGYGRYSELGAGMSDTQMALGSTRQGDPSTNWQDQEISKFNLPASIQMGEEYAFKRDNNESVMTEILWYNEMSRLLNKAFLPASYRAALQCMKIISSHGTPAVSQRVTGLVNPLAVGRHTSFGTQVDHHRDGNNAPLFASACFFGQDYDGAQLILDYLGITFYGGHGYSVHGALDILVHGVGKITCHPDSRNQPPQRISMALYAHADIFAAAARFSGSLKKPQIFSDPELWIPFYPAHFSLSDICDSLKAEDKRLYGKFRDEVRRFQAAL